MLRKVASADERAALDRVLMTSFSYPSSWAEWMELVGHDNLRVFDEGGAVVGGCAFYRMAQWFGGRSVPLAGVTGVGVLPEARGRGVAARMCGALLREAAAEGFPLAGLYASTATLYRSLGFEQAGVTFSYRAPVSSLGDGDARLPCRAVDPTDHAAFRPLYDARARAWTGHLDRTPAMWARVTRARKGQEVLAFVVGEPAEGYVVLAQTALDGMGYDVKLRDLVAASPAAAARVVALLAGLRSLARTVEWTGCGADPLVGLMPERAYDIVDSERWMVRVLDVKRALEDRGYPSMSGEAHLRVRDGLLAHNDECFVLRVERGAPSVERGGRGSVVLDVRALAALYSGFAHPAALRAAGLLEGDASGLATLFAGPEPWCCDHY